MKNFLFIGFVQLIFYGCFSISQEINKSFTTVANSLEKSIENQNQNLESLYSTISERRLKNKQLTQFADSVYLRTRYI